MCIQSDEIQGAQNSRWFLLAVAVTTASAKHFPKCFLGTQSSASRVWMQGVARKEESVWEDEVHLPQNEMP